MFRVDSNWDARTAAKLSPGWLFAYAGNSLPREHHQMAALACYHLTPSLLLSPFTKVSNWKACHRDTVDPYGNLAGLFAASIGHISNDIIVAIGIWVLPMRSTTLTYLNMIAPTDCFLFRLQWRHAFGDARCHTSMPNIPQATQCLTAGDH